MLLIPGLIDRATLARIETLLSNATFRSGKDTATGSAKSRKTNEELDETRHPEVPELVTRALAASTRLREYALPRAIRQPIIARYPPGTEYGYHMDRPVMGSRADAMTRADVSVTIFLAAPDTYDGGELVLRDGDGERMVKGPAGSAFLYPTDRLHRVAAVTAGVRLVAVTWIQSLIRDHVERAILHDLSRLGRALPADAGDAHDILGEVNARLVQRWSAL